MRRRRMLAILATGIITALLVAPAIGSAAPVAKSTKANTLHVEVVRFAKGTSRQHMLDVVAAAGGVVTTDLSKFGRLGVYAPNADFESRVRADGAVKAVWSDKTIALGHVDAGADGTGSASLPQLGNPGADPLPDPWHDLPVSLWGQSNTRAIWQWDDLANGASAAWTTTVGDSSIKVAVLDSGVSPSHKELKANLILTDNTIPCNLLTRQFGPGIGQRDCGNEDTDGHGTWVASRIAGANNGFASNGIAPQVKLMGYKVLSTQLGGGLTTWIVDGMVRACSLGADLINMSLGGYDIPGVDDEDYLLWVEATNYCLAHGTAIIASAGNDHVRVNRVNMTIGAVPLTGVGIVDSGDQGIASVLPGADLADSDRRGLLETPAGVPGVIMVSATNNENGHVADAAVPADQQWATVGKEGARDQLTYYSSYGSRIDIAAPGGARKYNIPRTSGGSGDILYGGWGELGALTASGDICATALGAASTFACFKVNGAAFGWLQGTSMSAPNATGVAALVLSAHPELRGEPAALLAHLRATARTGMTNWMGPNDPNNTSVNYSGVACETGFCYPKFNSPIGFADAYGAGIVNAAAAVQ